MAEVETSRNGGVLTITLNRPDVLNAFTAELHRQLVGAIKEARDPEVRAVVVTGAGRGFCGGQELKEVGGGGGVWVGGDWKGVGEGAGDSAARLRTNYHPTIRAVRGLEKPVLAAVNGPAAGAGLSFACACDLRLAGESATFVPAFINIGLVPDMGGTFFVTRLLGPSRAFEWMTSGRRLSAAEALEWGLVSEVVPDDRLSERAAEWAAELAAMPTRGIALSKRLFDNAQHAILEEQLEMEAQLQAAPTQTEDFREGVDAFLQKREPQFEGR